MKKIECFIRMSDVDAVVASLAKTGISSVSVYPIQGFGRTKGKNSVTLAPKMKLEVFALDIETDFVLGTILEVTRKGGDGDDKIAILPVDDVIRIRTGEKGAKAVF